MFKILHEKYKQTGKAKALPEIVEFRQSMEEAAEIYPEISPHINKAQVYMIMYMYIYRGMYMYI